VFYDLAAWKWQRRKDNAMIIVYELAAIGAAVIAAVAIWHKVQVQKRIRALDHRLARMQKEIEVLQMQESSRVMRALKGQSDIEAPGLDPADGDAGDDIESDVLRLVGKPRPTPVP
jgi:hypothetical protein